MPLVPVLQHLLCTPSAKSALAITCMTVLCGSWLSPTQLHTTAFLFFPLPVFPRAVPSPPLRLSIAVKMDEIQL